MSKVLCVCLVSSDLNAKLFSQIDNHIIFADTLRKALSYADDNGYLLDIIFEYNAAYLYSKKLPDNLKAKDRKYWEMYHGKNWLMSNDLYYSYRHEHCTLWLAAGDINDMIHAFQDIINEISWQSVILLHALQKLPFSEVYDGSTEENELDDGNAGNEGYKKKKIERYSSNSAEEHALHDNRDINDISNSAAATKFTTSSKGTGMYLYYEENLKQFVCLGLVDNQLITCRLFHPNHYTLLSDIMETSNYLRQFHFEDKFQVKIVADEEHQYITESSLDHWIYIDKVVLKSRHSKIKDNTAKTADEDKTINDAADESKENNSVHSCNTKKNNANHSLFMKTIAGNTNGDVSSIPYYNNISVKDRILEYMKMPLDIVLDLLAEYLPGIYSRLNIENLSNSRQIMNDMSGDAKIALELALEKFVNMDKYALLRIEPGTGIPFIKQAASVKYMIAGSVICLLLSIFLQTKINVVQNQVETVMVTRKQMSQKLQNLFSTPEIPKYNYIAQIQDHLHTSGRILKHAYVMLQILTKLRPIIVSMQYNGNTDKVSIVIKVNKPNTYQDTIALTQHLQQAIIKITHVDNVYITHTIEGSLLKYSVIVQY